MTNSVTTLAPAPQAAELEREAAYINAQSEKVFSIIIDIGQRLLSVQTRLKNERVFGQWIKDSLEISHQTAINYMRVANKFADCGELNAPLRVLYDAVKPSANGAALDALKADETHTSEGWYILSNAPDYLLKSYETNRIEETEAYKTAQYLRGKAIHPDVKTFALTHQIHYIEMLRYLNTARLDHDRTAGERTTWADLQDTNGYLSCIEQGAHMSYARQRDIDAYKAERAAMHRTTATIVYDWIQTTAPVVIVGGRAYLDISHMQATLTESERLLIKVRVKKDDAR